MAAVQAAENHGDFQTSFHEFYEKFKMAKFGTCETVFFLFEPRNFNFWDKIGPEIKFYQFHFH